MDVRNPRIYGTFALVDAGKDHRRTVSMVSFVFDWRDDGDEDWIGEAIVVPGNFRYDGSSRPAVVGWFIPRWGFSSEASCVHDFCFKTRPALKSGARISRKLTDEVFFAYLKWRAGSAASTQYKIRLAELMYRAVRWFGEPTWDKHDEEFR